MRIAVPDFVSSTFIPLIAAKKLGFFKEEGQHLEIVHIPALGDLEALRDGAVDFSAGPAHYPLVIFPEWRGLKLVATIAQGTPWMLVMRAGLAKRGEIAAVKGRRIAVDRGPERVFRYLLRDREGIESVGGEARCRVKGNDFVLGKLHVALRRQTEVKSHGKG